MKNYRRFFIKTLMKLGVISLLPTKLYAFNSNDGCEITTSDIEGPFYAGNYLNLYNITPFDINDSNQNFLIISGTVYASDCKTPIPNALVEIWHANQGSFNSKTNEFLNSSYEKNYFRGQINTDNFGNYSFLTVIPGKYLNGSYYRPSHIHYKVTYLNTELTSQIYFDGDISIPLDPWASSENASDRIITLFPDSNDISNGIFDITLNISPDNINTTNIENNTSVINTIYPNPISSNTIIKLNKCGKNSQIEIYDVNGNLIVRKINSATEINLLDFLDKPIGRGIYILKISTSNGLSQIKRFVV
ncbi:MAG: T9SS C-terminal target domain-containing protein [Flavobacteriales bacterium TMED191]|nr:MAG: T9SS C-terminal target domain-containing protein [Flavobacteriales bacterium TMED191]